MQEKCFLAEFKLQKDGFLNDICQEVIMSDIPEDSIIIQLEPDRYPVSFSHWVDDGETSNLKQNRYMYRGWWQTTDHPCYGCDYDRVCLYPQISYEG